MATSRNPPTNPPPPGRYLWRLVVQSRQFTAGGVPAVLAELTNAYGRRLEQNWDQAATLTFSLDGHDPAAHMLSELRTDVVAYRWPESAPAGRGEVAMFRGIVAHTEDQITESGHTVVFTCYDYVKMFERRLVTSLIDYSVVTIDQDSLVGTLVAAAIGTSSSGGTSFGPGAYLPVALRYCAPDGTARVAGAGVPVRNRTYLPSSQISQALDDLAKVSGGFDYDVQPGAAGSADNLRIFYPAQGLTRTEPVLMYGSNISQVTRTVNSGDYANYWRVVGNAANVDPSAPQLYSEVWDANANNVTVNPVGLWMSNDNAADVSIQSTLDQQAAGDLAISGGLMPTYTLVLTPGWWTYGALNMGDVVPLVINSGRLKVNTGARVLGIAYDMNDDGTETVTLTVGRQPVTFTQYVTQSDRTADALTRR
jgi:hypothetical protein